eukprot:CAMPEP_0201886382 /NCGR_PEP_ID=MMETSP0902-20130614/21922_1 /ASSEMBLY_ACC=CAM_ASM_000551 /TAXON_ID=420261 /ORGANISM="Thalassiosira antarctica, Strain CCMP982" /LENGTH=118 /DNA_ID=CAMNT_0048415943 /DNA_START=113 /DNA_END=465 /DNA_ORIENTATION=+
MGELCVNNVAEDVVVVSLPELTDMLLPLSLHKASAVDVAVDKLKRVPSASLRENVPLGESAFFLGDVMEVTVPFLLGEAAPRLGDLPRAGERLGEMSPNGDRTGDRTGDFNLVGLLFG